MGQKNSHERPLAGSAAGSGRRPARLALPAARAGAAQAETASPPPPTPPPRPLSVDIGDAATSLPAVDVSFEGGSPITHRKRGSLSLDDLPDEILHLFYSLVEFDRLIAHRAVSRRFNAELPWSVQHVDLRNRDLDNEAAVRLAQFLQSYTGTIERVDLAYNDLGYQGAGMIGAVLSSCPRLEAVDMRYNALPPACCHLVSEALQPDLGSQCNPSLEINQFEYLCAECDHVLALEGDFRSDGTYGHGLLAKFFYHLGVDVRGEPYDQTLSSGRYKLQSDLRCPCCDVVVGGWKYLHSYENHPENMSKVSVYVVADTDVIEGIPTPDRDCVPLLPYQVGEDQIVAVTAELEEIEEEEKTTFMCNEELEDDEEDEDEESILGETTYNIAVAARRQPSVDSGEEEANPLSPTRQRSPSY